MVNPTPKTAFHQRMEDRKDSQYLSKKKAPLGKFPIWEEFGAKAKKTCLIEIHRIELSFAQRFLGTCHDQRPGLPEGMGLYNVAYGIPTVRDGKAGDIINPPKSRKQVNLECDDGKDLYKFSHHAYDVGETYDRNYNWHRVPKTSTFGVETPHDNDGIQVRKSLKWLYNTQT